MADKYILRVTAGSTYDLDAQTEVPVNAPETVKISNQFLDAELNVRVQNYHGLPRNSPETSPYFSLEPHAANKDQYSIALRLTFKKPDAAASEGDDAEAAAGISGADLQFGNDFDHPIRDKLPPGFSYAMNIVKWWIDPGLDGDAYADSPYLYGPGLSSFNAVHVGPGEYDPERGGLCFSEGGDEAGLASRRSIGAPDTAKERMKWALRQDSKDKWDFEYGRPYCVDFFNPYLDFGDFSLKLPGFTLPIMKYWDGQGLSPKRSHTLRYVLRNKTTNDVYLVLLFTIYRKEDVNEDGSLKPAAIADAKRTEAEAAAAVEAEAGKGEESNEVD